MSVLRCFIQPPFRTSRGPHLQLALLDQLVPDRLGKLIGRRDGHDVRRAGPLVIGLRLSFESSPNCVSLSRFLNALTPPSIDPWSADRRAAACRTWRSPCGKSFQLVHACRRVENLSYWSECDTNCVSVRK